MKKVFASITALLALSSSAFALPNTVTGNLNVGTSNFGTVLSTYNVASNGTVYSPLMTGAGFSSSLQNPFLAELNHIGNVGGTLNVIFLGETAGYTHNSVTTPANFTIFTEIQSATLGGDLNFGDFVTLGVAAGSTVQLKFKSESGLIFDLFSYPPAASQQVSYSTTNYVVSSSIPAVGPFNTYVLGVEDVWFVNSDHDFNDVILAFQFNPSQPFIPVPEPSTYGMIGAAALLGLVAFRRFKSKK